MVWRVTGTEHGATWRTYSFLVYRRPWLDLGRLQRQCGIWGKDLQTLCGQFGEGEGCQSPDESSQQQGRQTGGYRSCGQYFNSFTIYQELHSPSQFTKSCLIHSFLILPSQTEMVTCILWMTKPIKSEPSGLSKATNKSQRQAVNSDLLTESSFHCMFCSAPPQAGF